MIVNYNFDIEESKDGLKILKIHKDNKKIYVGSKYRMRECIDKILKEDNKIEDGFIFVIFGIPNEEYIKGIYENNKKIKVIIFEPNTNLIEYIKNNDKQYRFLAGENIYLLNAKNEEEVYLSLKNLIQEFDLTKIIYKSYLNYDKIYEQQILKFNTVVKNVINDIAIKRNTQMYFYKRWFETLTKNLKHMVGATPINLLKNKYKDIPAIIVSAGPSLNKNINDLHNIDKDILIFSGGRTLRPLVENNIEPSLIGVVDPGEISYELVENYIEKTKSPLLFYEGTNEKVVEGHQGQKIIFTQNTIIHDIFKMEVEDIGVGGSVAHDLTATAKYLGCNPIIFIGQDLAYTGEKYHADIAINQFKKFDENIVSNETENIYVEDVNGDKVKTSIVLDNFRREMEIFIENNKDTTFINATEGGAKIKGTIQMTLKDAISKYKLNSKISFMQNIEQVDKNKINNNTIEILNNIIEADQKIIKQATKALEVIKDLDVCLKTGQNTRLNKYLKNLDVIDDVIRENYEKLDILRSIIYPIIYHILSGNKPKTNKDIIENNKFLYQSILEVSKEVLKPIKNVKCDIEKMENEHD
ncbi:MULTISPECIES: motility associated factor glycosyltransferase family protein [Clostridium]|uniref:motility associated factor glycosyltransferase family protein n=1 Tax=Clostridium TaxID=1485 RepID=UPI0004D671E9|nr:MULTISPECIES: 6-hydroxymethylpterin diphosphokinase MptE-like protein [Clostridium]KEH88690.1 hypothetical protein Z967_01335 [Clostridium novyi A str. 4540]KEH94312.1 hypothetical protein Z963_10090 [Clostridium botulinum C/D str. It1]KEH95010.1 hypothetical protein Z964_10215 [Clostridium novyi A str. GD211209]